ncbi:hypothetical protein ACH4FX_12430 [Streptomyces sp. NPDC018019]|uniref:hypothetical protein n=1 Tax=Streptomyces sp. NPDC018019 TaxID=3365030 RepID=UPI0037999DDC
MTIFRKAISDGDRRVQLEAMRDQLAAAIQRETKGSDIAALTLRLMKVLEALDGVPDDQQASAFDELSARRVGGDKSAARRQGGRRRRGST